MIKMTMIEKTIRAKTVSVSLPEYLARVVELSQKQMSMTNFEWVIKIV